MITLFGATGLTGRQIATVLDQQEIPFRIAGRSGEKLSRLSASLESKPSWISADATRPSTLSALFANSQVLINCAGPFTDLGEKVIMQAAMSGNGYLDITNELGYFFRVRGYHEMAQRTGATLVPACGFEVALADCAAAVMAHKINQTNLRKDFDEINILYRLGGKSASRGTRRSAIRSLGTSWLTYRDGSLTGMIPGSEVRKFDLPAGSQHAFIIPSCESATIPAHIQANSVDVWMTTSQAMHFWAPIFIPLLARASRSILRDPILSIAGSGGIKAENMEKAEKQEDSPFQIVLRMRQENKLYWMNINGQDPYGLTAQIVVFAAQQLLDIDGRKKGFLSPAQALDPQKFLDMAVKHWKIAIDEGISMIN